MIQNNESKNRYLVFIPTAKADKKLKLKLENYEKLAATKLSDENVRLDSLRPNAFGYAAKFQALKEK